MSDRSGNLEIWVCDSDGSNALQLTSFGGPQATTPRWSPDGGRIAFDSDAEGEYDIWVIGANGGKPQRMTTHPANDGNPSLLSSPPAKRTFQRGNADNGVGALRGGERLHQR